MSATAHAAHGGQRRRARRVQGRMLEMTRFTGCCTFGAFDAPTFRPRACLCARFALDRDGDAFLCFVHRVIWIKYASFTPGAVFYWPDSFVQLLRSGHCAAEALTL
eukprot:scaffold31815_cov118-Isochrysis_galbana.AAC.2